MLYPSSCPKGHGPDGFLSPKNFDERFQSNATSYAILFTSGLFFIFLLIFTRLWWLGDGHLGLGLVLGFSGWVFSLWSLGPVSVRPSGFFGVGALYINIEVRLKV